MIILGILLIASPLLIVLIYSGHKYGWDQYWTGGDEGPW